ncbi:MAG: adenosylhomocysteinase [Candidatus Marinimicrobia bacterium CG08_land_8_20_14_0_20_45_22]|nr:MAG: adenosylhomocysteinase [Candidatus Marinimicrobia bacterium CG08_land_8_20_14_0_20_45_22]
MIGKIKDIKLADAGRLKIEWAEAHMPVLMALKKKYIETKPLAGMRISGCLHVTKETAVLIKTLIAAGAEVAWSGCNPLSTQDDVAAALYADGVPIWAWRGLNTEEFYWCIEQTLQQKPTATLDDGADLVFTIHNKHPELAKQVLGGSEETTTGVHRLRAMGNAGKLLYPIVAVNDAETKWDFDNVYGTGQSSIDGILRATSILLAGKTFVVAGYGHCGKGVAMRAKGMGADVIATEVKPTAALKSILDGVRVMKMDEAAKIGDIFITATGMKEVIVKRHFEAMKDGAIVCNTGHYDCELDLKELETITVSKNEVRPNCVQYTLKNGKRIFVLAEGRLVNLAAAEGHPSEVMDMSFANQFMAVLFIAQKGAHLEKKVYDITEEQDQEIAQLKLETMSVSIDKLTESQIRYQTAYNEGT